MSFRFGDRANCDDVTVDGTVCRPTEFADAGHQRRGAARTHFAILGPFEVFTDGTYRSLSASKLRTLLAILLVRANTVVPVETLIRELWDSNPPRTALPALRVYVSQLRKLVPADGWSLLTQPPGYKLAVAPCMVDALKFDSLSWNAGQVSRAGNFERAGELYREALALWRGQALADIQGGSIVRGAALRLDEARIAALERRIDVDLRLGRYLDLVAELRGLVAEHPFDEGIHARLMIALHYCGRTSEALAQYRQIRDRLVEEVGVEPGVHLYQVHQSVLSADPAARPMSSGWTF